MVSSDRKVKKTSVSQKYLVIIENRDFFMASTSIAA
jgi:hypothetical protein